MAKILILLIVASILFCLFIIYRQHLILKSLTCDDPNCEVHSPRPRSQERVEIRPARTSLYADRSIALGGIYTTPETKAYYSSATIPERRWQNVGVLTNDVEILNLYTRPTTYNEDIWQYRVQDKDGFMIEIGEIPLLKNGMMVDTIPGKPGIFKVNLYKKDIYYY
jgi:hypothetical protein